MNYKELSNEDKIATIAEYNFWKNERAAIEPYIVALKTNDSAVIEEFEALGDHPYQIALNRHQFTRASTVYGFTHISFNKHGWLEREAFMDCETFNFGYGIKGTLVGNNSLTVGRGPNGKWTYGRSFAASNSGYGCALSVFSEPHNSRHESLRYGLKEMIAWHTKENDTKTAPVLKEAKDMLDEITGRKPKQLSLFFEGGAWAATPSRRN